MVPRKGVTLSKTLECCIKSTGGKLDNQDRDLFGLSNWKIGPFCKFRGLHRIISEGKYNWCIIIQV